MTRHHLALGLAATTALLPSCSDQELVVVHEEAPDIQVEPSSLDFGSLGPGDAESRTATITNLGDAPLRLDEVKVSGGDAAFVLDTPVAAGHMLEPAASLEVQVTCAGPHDGANQALLEVDSNSPGEPEVTVPLTATGLVPELVITPDAWDLGTWGFGCSASQTFDVANVGSVSLVVDGWSFSAAPDDGSMQAVATSLEAGMVLDPGQVAQVDVHFTPAELTTYDGTLTVWSVDPMPLEASAVQDGRGIEGGWRTDHFEQEGNNLTDILWVVDNSGSMDDEQDSIADNFDAFMDIVDTLGIDYHMAVITTDNAFFRSSGGFTVIDSSTPDASGRFGQMVRVGTNGSGDEKGLKYSYDALQPSLTASVNAGFLREDAGLRIIYVSDEPDQSPQDWTYYRDYFQGMRPGDPDFFIGSSVVGLDASGNAAPCTGPGGSADAGIGYQQIASDTGGVLASICASDWSATLTSLAWITLNLADRFELSATPIPETITVAVDGVNVTTGWSYDAAYNQVVFEAEYVPGNDSMVDITYALPGDCDG